MEGGRIRWFGLACLVGGLMWFGTGLLTLSGIPVLDTESGGISGDLFFVLTNLCLMGGPLGLLALGAAGTGWKRAIAVMGAAITLLAQCSYIAGALGSIALGQQEHELVFASRAGGALLVGLGMIVLGTATAIARRLPGWRRWAALIVALYYVVMIPIQIVFFISRGHEPSLALLTLWGVTWTVLGYAIATSAQTIVDGQGAVLPSPL